MSDESTVGRVIRETLTNEPPPGEEVLSAVMEASAEVIDKTCHTIAVGIVALSKGRELPDGGHSVKVLQCLHVAEGFDRDQAIEIIAEGYQRAIQMEAQRKEAAERDKAKDN